VIFRFAYTSIAAAFWSSNGSALAGKVWLDAVDSVVIMAG